MRNSTRKIQVLARDLVENERMGKANRYQSVYWFCVEAFGQTIRRTTIRKSLFDALLSILHLRGVCFVIL